MIKKAKYYLQGHFNYWRHKKNLLPTHLVSQVYYKAGLLDSVCYKRNECQKLKCGCNLVIQLYSNKTCNKCNLPKFVKKKDWKHFRALTKIWKKGYERLKPKV